MSFPPYTGYQSSGVEWLGEVPSHWEVAPLKHVAALIAGQSPNSADCNEKGAGLPFLQGCAEFGEEYPTPRQYCELPPKQARAGDLLLSVRAPVGELNVADQTYGIGRGLCAIRSISGEFAFLRHVLAAAVKALQSVATGSTYQAVSSEQIGSLRLPMPPADEQVAIAAFLDRETAKIDALIEEQRRLIALLKEKRQAVISHAVTKGLDPHAPMKDSGIEWLGEVPAHWASAKVKHACSHVVDCLHTTPTYEGDLLYPAIRTADIERGKLLLAQARLVSKDIYEQRIERLRPIANDVLYSREGERFGLAALVPIGVDLCLGQRMMMFRTLPHASPAYFMWALNSDAVYQQVVSRLGGATSPHINIGDIVNFCIPEPPLAEQRAIADHIATEVAALDDLAEIAASAITLLQERRAALISAAVTGKIDVRGSAKVLPFPIERARARALVATEIIERSAGQPTFGRVKFQKVVFLAEGHVGISELEGSYLREAAGPLDRALIDDMDRGAHRLAGIERDQPGGFGTNNTYRLGPERRAHRQELADWLGPDRTAKLDKLITDFADLSTKGAEAVATLYGVWNDALAEGASPSDDEIIHGFLNDWHDEKRKKFRASDLPEWLGWMRRHGIVPNGSGPKSARQVGALL